MSSRGRLFTRLPPLVRVPDLSDAMRLALQWLEMLEGRPLCEHPNFRRMDEAERRSIRPVVLKRLIGRTSRRRLLRRCRTGMR